MSTPGDVRAAVASFSAPDLRGGARAAWVVALLTTCAVLWEAPRQPFVILILPIACVGIVLAVRSPAWPLGVITGATLIALLANGRLPQGGTVAAYTAWLLLALAVAVIRRDRAHPPLRLVLDFSAAGTIAIAALMLARLPASSDSTYGVQKIELFLLIGVLPYIVGMIVGFERRDLELFFRVFVAMVVAAAVYNSFLVASGAANQQFSDRYSLDESIDVIGLGRTMGAVALILLFMIVRATNATRRLLLALALVPVAITFVSSGSRGPVIGMVVALPSVLLWRAASPAVARRLAASLVAVGALAVVAVVWLVPPEATQRSLSIFQTTQETGDTSRFILWSEALHAFSSSLTHSLVGIGTGGYAAIATTGALYPHNIVLEVGAELGILGLLALAAFVISVVVRLLRLLRGGGETAGWAGLLLTLFVFALVNAQFSGDVPYNSGLWLWGGIATGLAAAARTRSQPLPHQRF
jgi:O-antigen ligase